MTAELLAIAARGFLVGTLAGGLAGIWLAYLDVVGRQATTHDPAGRDAAKT